MVSPPRNDTDDTPLNAEVQCLQEEQNAASPTRLYFLPQEADSSATSAAFYGGTDDEPAIRVEASKFAKLVWKAEIQEGLHNVRMAVNLKNLKLEKIETLSITQYDGDALEIFTRDELQEFVGDSESRMVILGLHRQYPRGEATVDVATFTMEFRTLYDPLPQDDPGPLLQDDPGYLELEYIELSPYCSCPVCPDCPDCPYCPICPDCSVCAVRPVVDGNNDTRMHKPFLWSIDMRIQHIAAVIIDYSVSGDGNYVATLSIRDKIIQLDVWDLESGTQSKEDKDDYNEKRGPFAPKPCDQHQISLKVLSDAAKYDECREQLSISISHDASMIVLMCGKGKVYKKALFKKTFRAFSFKKTTTGDSGQRELQPLKDREIDAHLRTFCGFGKFHLINGRDSWMQRYITGRKTDMQRFITCDETCLNIYRFDKKWELTLRIIHSSKDCPTVTIPRSIIGGIRGNMISWLDKDNTLRVCDLEAGKLVHAMTFEGTVSLSKNGLLMVCFRTSKTINTTPGAINTILATIETRWIRSSTIIATAHVEVDAESQPSLEFIDNDRRIIVSSVIPDNDFGRGAQGMILDATTLSLVERVSYPTKFSMQQSESTGTNGQYLFTQHGSKLDLIRLQDIVVVPHCRPRSQCNKKCMDGLIDITESFICPPSKLEAIPIPGTSLIIAVEFQGYAVVVSMSNHQGGSHKILKIPPLMVWGQYRKCRIHVDPDSNHLIADCCLLVMVWKLPATLDDSVTLLTVLWTQPSTYSATTVFQRRRKELFSTKLMKCRHGYAYTIFEEKSKKDSTLPLFGNWACNPNFRRLVDGLLVLIGAFHNGDDAFQQATLRFTGLHINKTMDKSWTTLGVICDNIKLFNYNAIHTFLKELFSSPHVRWVPKPGATDRGNPLYSLFWRGNFSKDQRISLTRNMIDHCVNKAEKEKDQRFLLPVLDALMAVVYFRESFPGLVPKILRKMAFLPVNDISQAITAQPLKFQWPSREHGTRIIDRSNKPDLQLRSLPLSKGRVHVAPLDMLWGLPGRARGFKGFYSLNGLIRYTFQSLFFVVIVLVFITKVFIQTLLILLIIFIIFLCLPCGALPKLLSCLRKLPFMWSQLSSLPQIMYRWADYYEFNINAMDHPAVNALLEYKWNTIGFKYWMVKFVWKSIYYILVLLTVFMQVYDTTQREGIFIVIIIMASMFLYVEVFRIFFNFLAYFKSPYNYINVLAFVLPIVGSVNQISNIEHNRDGDVSALSFSVLFIFLHIFLELRVFKDVSLFVAMVSRALYKVRVFFLFFVTGILAFSIAILHLLRGCPVDSCENNDVKFPQSFYRALSSTYFFMGGVWDPITNEFENGNWKFLVMMALYFFFTNILLLNLIIALMNMSFEDGLGEYESVRRMDILGWVQGAEIMSYWIPGFRATFDVFPDEIYYHSTKEEMEKFYAKFPQDGDISNDTDHQQDEAQVSSEPKLDPTTGSSGVIATQSGTLELKAVQQIQEALERQQEERHEDLKRELQFSREQTLNLQEQLRTQKAEFDLQLQTLQDQMSRILAALKVTS
ncbi:MAG: hypothetical protein J3Q66DRAFT_158186 [Benniella sp.]|nr:MAG: hypothetical protein J3Q66DRAFT_158186 [Benniella sp.]